MITTVEQAMIELEAAEADMRAELGDEIDECGQDMVVSVAWNIDDVEVGRAFLQTQLGYVPQELEHKFGKRDWLEGVL